MDERHAELGRPQQLHQRAFPLDREESLADTAARGDTDAGLEVDVRVEPGARLTGIERHSGSTSVDVDRQVRRLDQLEVADDATGVAHVVERRLERARALRPARARLPA